MHAYARAHIHTHTHTHTHTESALSGRTSALQGSTKPSASLQPGPWGMSRMVTAWHAWTSEADSRV